MQAAQTLLTEAA